MNALNAEGLDLAFRDRREAGAELATRLEPLKGRSDIVVLALPRGGVPVAWEVARSLGASLDVLVVRKLGVPGRRELAMGAVASGNVIVLDEQVIAWYRIASGVIDDVIREERAELERRERLYRLGRDPIDVQDRLVVLIDDGLATGSTMKAAVENVRARKPKGIVVAVPVGAPDTCHQFEGLVDQIVCARMPRHFAAVGDWYGDFSQTTDEEVQALLRDRA